MGRKKGEKEIEKGKDPLLSVNQIHREKKETKLLQASPKEGHRVHPFHKHPATHHEGGRGSKALSSFRKEAPTSPPIHKKKPPIRKVAEPKGKKKKRFLSEKEPMASVRNHSEKRGKGFQNCIKRGKKRTHEKGGEGGKTRKGKERRA